MKFDKNDPSMEEMIRFTGSPAGKKLISYLQANGGNSIHEAKKAAEAGNFEQAKANLSELMNTKSFQDLIREMEKQNG